MKNFLILTMLLGILTSCGRENKPKIVHDSSGNTTIKEPKKDSTFIEIADLPIQIDSTNYLIHIIGDYKIEDDRGKIMYKSSSYGGAGFSVSNYSGYQISGNISNVKFQQQDAEELTALTSDLIKIRSISFLYDVYKNTEKQFLVYKVIDSDTNQDGKLDYNDVTTLYISKIDGSGFTKITDTNKELIDWKVIKSNNRLYFRTIEDINKDGKFDKKDNIYYKYVNLNADTLKVTAYNPI